MTKNTIIIITTLLIGLSKGQHIVNRDCIERPVLQNFDLDKYLASRWFEISRYEQRFEIGCDCGYADYTLNEDGSVKVNNCCKRLPNTTTSCTVGKAVLSYPNQNPIPGKLSVAFRGKEPSESNYWILDTDYETFSIVYFCRGVEPGKSAEAFWLLSPSKQLSTETKAKTDAYIELYFDSSALRIALQSDDKCGSD